MNAQDLGKEVHRIAEPIARALALEIVEVSCHGKGTGLVIRVTIDKEEGVNIGDCEQFHQSLSRALDVEDPIPFSYRLEVSSPGIDRPLRSEKDYKRVVGRMLQVSVHDPQAGQREIVGRLEAVTDSGIVLAVQRGKPKQVEAVEIVWDTIKNAKQMIEL